MNTMALDLELRGVLAAVQKCLGTTSMPDSDIGLLHLRELRASIENALPRVCSILDAADAAELEEVERKVAQLRERLVNSHQKAEAREVGKPSRIPENLGLVIGGDDGHSLPTRNAIEGADAPARDPSTLTQAERAKLKWAETDAGRIGAGRVDVDDGTTAEEFIGDLHDLRLQTAEKRKRLRG